MSTKEEISQYQIKLPLDKHKMLKIASINAGYKNMNEFIISILDREVFNKKN